MKNNIDGLLEGIIIEVLMKICFLLGVYKDDEKMIFFIDMVDLRNEEEK